MFLFVIYTNIFESVHICISIHNAKTYEVLNDSHTCSYTFTHIHTHIDIFTCNCMYACVMLLALVMITLVDDQDECLLCASIILGNAEHIYVNIIYIYMSWE